MLSLFCLAGMLKTVPGLVRRRVTYVPDPPPPALPLPSLTQTHTQGLIHMLIKPLGYLFIDVCCHPERPSMSDRQQTM